MPELSDLFSEHQVSSLTKNQRSVADYIVKCIDDTGVFPSIADIARFRGDKYRMGAYQYLVALADKGILKHIGVGDAGRRHFALRAKVLLLPEVDDSCLDSQKPKS